VANAILIPNGLSNGQNCRHMVSLIIKINEATLKINKDRINVVKTFSCIFMQQLSFTESQDIDATLGSRFAMIIFRSAVEKARGTMR